MVLEHLCPEVVEVPWQSGPLQVWIGLPHIRVVGVVRWVVVVLARKVEVVCNSVVSELITVLQKGLKSSTYDKLYRVSLKKGTLAIFGLFLF